MQLKRTYLAIVASAYLTGLPTFAANAASIFPYGGGRLDATALQSSAMPIGDLNELLPIYGSQNEFFYASGDFKIGNRKTWLMSPGVGSRRIVNDHIWGVYGFADYQNTYPNSIFWVINPGVEWMSSQWDARVNGYIPTQRTKATGEFFSASSIGNYNYVQFSGHTQIDALFQPVVAIGPGLDGQVGFTFDVNKRRGRVFGGGYYYASPLSGLKKINGAAAGARLPLNKYFDVVAQASYDNLNHALGSFGIRVTFGDERIYSTHVQDRILEHIDRHVGVINTGAGSFAQAGYADTGMHTVTQDKIWFFMPGDGDGLAANPTITYSACTFEHPCNNFGQTAVNEINTLASNATFYMAPGAYQLSSTNLLMMHKTQSIYGRTMDYRSPATGDTRAQFLGTLQAPGNNLFDSIRIQNTDVSYVSPSNDTVYSAMYLQPSTGTEPVTITNSELIASSNTGGEVISLYAYSQGVLNVDNTSIEASNTGSGAGRAIGIGNNSRVTITNVQLTGHSSGSSANGLYSDNSQVNLTNAIVDATNTGIGQALAINTLSNSNATITDSQLTSRSSGSFANGVFSSGSQVSLTNTVVDATNTGVGQARAIGIQSNSSATITDSQLTSRSSGSFANGLFSDNSQASITNAVVEATNTGAGQARAISIQSNSSATITESQITARSSGGLTQGIALLTTSQLTLTDSQINAIYTGANTSSTGAAKGIRMEIGSSATVTGTTVSANSSTTAVGLYNGSTGSLNFSNGLIAVNGTIPPNTITFVTVGAGPISITNSTCSVNGVEVACP